MTEIYLLTLILALAAGLAIFTKRLGLPLLVSYVAIGAVLSALHIIKPGQLEFLAILPEIGLALLLFLVGMELDLAEFKSVGKKIVFVTLAQVFLTTGIIYLVTNNVILAVAVSFSSTILVVKLLIEEKELQTLHGKLSVGILLIEDLLAVVLLMLMTVFWGGQNTLGSADLFLVLIKGAFLIALAIFAGKRLLPAVFKLTADSTELLFLTAIAWCLVFVSISLLLSFSLPIGAFLAGVSLAQSVYRVQISGKIKPLRDFFIMIFFLDLGTGLSISGLGANIWLGVFFIIYAVIVKPVIFYFLFTLAKFRAHPAFQTGVYISSISEFSLIVFVAGMKLGLVDKALLSPLIFATVLSFVLSSMLVTHRMRLYHIFGRLLKKFEREGIKSVRELTETELSGHAVLIGCHRSGEIVLRKLQKMFGEKLMVLDFNPDVISVLKERGVPCLYGDITDPEILENLKLAEAKLVVSTVRDISDNLILLDALKKAKAKAKVVITAQDAKEELLLKEKGADIVSQPTDLEGHYISGLLNG